MTRPSLVPFKAEHLIKLNGSFDDGRTKELHPAFTAMLEDKVLGSAGIVIPWPGMGIAWSVFSEDLFQYKIWMTRNVRNALRDIMRAHKLHRVEMNVTLDNGPAQAWAELLGFTDEGIAKQFTYDKKDVIRYSILRDSINIRRLSVYDGSKFLELVAACDTKWAHQPFSWFHRECTTLVAIQNDKLLGYTVHEYINMESFSGLVAYGRNIGVHPDARGFGIATMLQKVRLMHAKMDGARFFIGLVHGENRALAKMFESTGGKLSYDHGDEAAYVYQLGD